MRWFLALFILLFSPLKGEEKKDFVLVPVGTTHQGDYFASGNTVEIFGTILGDAYIAGGQVFVHGEIDGDLIVLAGSTEISGTVKGNIRILAGQITVNGDVGKNATVLGANVQLASSSKILGNVVCIAGNGDLSGPVQGNALLITSNGRFSGTVDKNLQAHVGQLRLTSRASILGNFDVHSSKEPEIDTGATIQGMTTWHHSSVQDFLQGKYFKGFMIGSKFIGLLMNFLFTFVIGILLIKLYPKTVSSAVHALNKHPWKACGLGVLVLIVLPLASILLLMTILGAPFAIALIAVNVVSFYTAKIFSIQWVGSYLNLKAQKNLSPMGILAIGLIIYYGLSFVPILGFWIAIAALLFGLGGVTLGRLIRKH